ncbi:RTX toxin [Labilithrix luteola]|uniref:RTX toxin n=1 Tax=Labilithrix luteola TaxID=1391654 RepID=A0A0K1Q0C3_9BACT|nr:DUF4215 domain-containing protein [Labilithrix luteola]AKU98854.1 RTX toxin [Labilithrix luteola]
MKLSLRTRLDEVAAKPKRSSRSARARQVTAGLAFACTTFLACASDQIVAYQDDVPDASDPATLITDSDGGKQSSKPDAADADATVGTCGNHVLDDGEGCDDGNTKDGDGCSSTCTVESTSPEDTCPGLPIPLSATGPSQRSGTVSGDTSSATPNFQSANCGGGNGKDVVYSLTSDVPGRVRAHLNASFDAFLALRSDCLDDASESACKAVPTGGGGADLVFPIAANQTVYLVVDGVAGKSGPFTIDVEIATSICGDGLAQYPEQCDDNNTVAGDGCSPTCQFETPMAAAGKCPGASYTLVGSPTGPTKISVAGDVTLLANTASSFGCSASSGKDQVYAITPTISGAITAEMTAAFPKGQLHARRECFNSSTEIDCHAEPLAGSPVRITFPVAAENTYFVFADVDGTPASGLYTLDLTLAPATCGNGVLETPEGCDDGNTVNGDGCSATCALEPMPASLDTCPGMPIVFAGDPTGPQTFRTTASTAILSAAVKSCSGTLDRKDAVYTFVAPYDGWVSAKAKGNFNLLLDLRADCILESASGSGTSVICSKADGGNGEESIGAAITAGKTYYFVVEGSTTNANKEGVYTLDVALRRSVCGNGIIEGGETCDDGAHVDGDGCAANCLLEPTPSTRTTCANAEALNLTETTVGSGVYAASAFGGNWNLPGGGYFAAPCAGAGKEAYFTVTPPIDGVVSAITNSTYNISLGVRPACPPNTSTGFLTCSDRSTGNGSEKVSFPAKAGTKYWIIVDAPGVKDLGSFTLDVSMQAQTCGDGIVGGDEECDDGNALPGDGCNACHIEPLANADTCPGEAIRLTGTGTQPREKAVTLSTTSLSADYAGTCGGNGRDGVIAVTSDVTGTLTALLNGSWPTVFYARTSCTNSTTELACKKYDATKPAELVRDMSFTVQAGVPTYFFIDGLSGASGPATLLLTVTP